MKYIRPRSPEKEIALCLDLFDKKEAARRILEFIENVIDDVENQIRSTRYTSNEVANKLKECYDIDEARSYFEENQPL